MTKDQLRLPSWAVPLLVSAIVALAVAWTQLSGTESAAAHTKDIGTVRTDHTADVTRLQAAIREAENQRDMDFIRDSAWKADAMRILLDIQRKANR